MQRRGGQNKASISHQDAFAIAAQTDIRTSPHGEWGGKQLLARQVRVESQRQAENTCKSFCL